MTIPLPIRTAAITLFASVVAAASGAAQAAGGHYHVVGKIAVGTTGNGYTADFIVIDDVNRRLYGLGNTIVDIDADKVVDSIPGKAAGGYALATDLGTGLARNGTFFDLK